MRVHWWVALLIVPAFPAIAAAGPPGDYAEFHYAGAARIFGTIEGECRGVASLSTETAKLSVEATTEVVRTTWNETTLNPGSPQATRIIGQRFQSTQSGPMVSGQIIAHLERNGDLRIFSEAWPAQSMLPIQFTGDNATIGVLAERVSDDEYYVRDGSNVQARPGGSEGLVRQLVMDQGTVKVDGPGAVVVHDGIIEGNLKFVVPPRQNHRLTSNAVIDVVEYVDTHLVIRASKLSLAGDEGWALACQELDMRFDGSATAMGATGRVTKNGRTVQFVEKDLSIEGSGRLREHGTESALYGRRIQAAWDGQFSVVATDYVAADALSVDPITIVLVVSGGIGFLLAGAALYSRLALSSILNHRKRDLIRLTVKENPWIREAELQRKTGLAPSTMRYHVGKLVQHGLLATVREEHETLYVAREQGAVNAVPRPPLKPVEIFIAKQCVGAVPRTHLQRELVREFGYGERGAWYLLKRMVTQGKLMVENRDSRRKKWVRWRTDY